MRCSIRDCPGGYEERTITHTVRHEGRIVVIDGVPAEVCDTCGDILLNPQTVRHIEELLEGKMAPIGSAPVFEYT